MTTQSIMGSHAAADIHHYQHDLQRFTSGKVRDEVFLETRLRYGVYGQRQEGVHMMRSKLPLGILNAAQLQAFADILDKFGGDVAHITTRQDIQIHFVALKDTAAFMHDLDFAGMTSREACGNVVRNITASPLAGVSPDEAFDVTPYGMALAKFLLLHPESQNFGRKLKITLSGTDDGTEDLSLIHDIGLTARLKNGHRGFRVMVGGGLGPVPHQARLFSSFVDHEELLPLVQAILRVFAVRGEKKKRARARLKFLVAHMGMDAFRTEVNRVLLSLEHDERWTAHLNQDDLQRFDDAPQAQAHSKECTEAHGAMDMEQLKSTAYQQWLRTNVLPQRQAQSVDYSDTPSKVYAGVDDSTSELEDNSSATLRTGYYALKVRVPRGDLDSAQLRGLSCIVGDLCGPALRIGLDQSLYLRWVPEVKLPAIYAALSALGLAQPGAGVLGDTVTCPGADTCKLGITRPRLLARSIQSTLDRLAKNERLAHLCIHVSGCPNACSQHHIADIGFYGAARTVQGVTAPSYMLFLGGAPGGISTLRGIGHQPQLWAEADPSAGVRAEGVAAKDAKPSEPAPLEGFGRVVCKVFAHKVGDAIELLTALYLQEGIFHSARAPEPFARFVRRVGTKRIKEILHPLNTLPSPKEAPWMYREPGSNETFVVNRGVGECAGAVVEVADLLLKDADREVEQAVEAAETVELSEEVRVGVRMAMLYAARALLSTQNIQIDHPRKVVEAFEHHFYDTGAIFEGIGYYFLSAQKTAVAGSGSAEGSPRECRAQGRGDEAFQRHEPTSSDYHEETQRLVAEASIFVDEVHSMVARIRGAAGSKGVGP